MRMCGLSVFESFFFTRLISGESFSKEDEDVDVARERARIHKGGSEKDLLRICDLSKVQYQRLLLHLVVATTRLYSLVHTVAKHFPMENRKCFLIGQDQVVPLSFSLCASVLFLVNMIQGSQCSRPVQDITLQKI